MPSPQTSRPPRRPAPGLVRPLAHRLPTRGLLTRGLLVLGLLTFGACSTPGPRPESSPEPTEASAPGMPEALSESTRPATPVARTIAAIQGREHHSPLAGQRVTTRGVVTAIGEEVFFFQDAGGDDEPATSEGLCVVRAGDTPEIGQGVEVTGVVIERRRREGDLPVTCLRPERLEVFAERAALPPPVLLGDGGRRVPDEVADDDGLRRFEPESDGVDFFESLEGMRVEIAGARVVGARDRRGQLVVVVGDGDPAHRSARGGLLLRRGDDNPEAVMVDGGLGVETPSVDVGQRLGRFEAVVDYGFGAYRLSLVSAPEVSGGSPAPERTRLGADDRHLTVASFNVLNLAGNDPPEKFADLARVVVDSLGSPDVLALQEVQDENGAVDDGTVGAERTYERLIDAVASAGGPRYSVRQLDPEDGADGGQPGGNIRVAFLFREDRLRALDAGAGDDGREDRLAPGSPTLVVDGGGPRLVPSPARLGGPAFDADPAGGFGGTRKPLVTQFRFHDHDLFLVNLHLTSKGGDDGVFGDVQPPVRHTEPRRIEQARTVTRWVDELLAADPDAFVLVLGDYNELPWRPPLDVFAEAGLENLIERVPEKERYTYVYRGNSQVLDHVLASPAVLEQTAPEIDIVHTCSDYAAERQASDHEPIVVRLRFLLDPEDLGPEEDSMLPRSVNTTRSPR